MKKILDSNLLGGIEGPFITYEDITLDKMISGDDEARVKELLHTLVKPYIKSLAKDIQEQIKDCVSYVVQMNLNGAVCLHDPIDCLITPPKDMHLFYCWVWEVVFSEDGEQHVDINEIIFDNRLFPNW